MRIDHLAYRVADRKKTAQFFMDSLGYKVQQEFTIDFGDGQTAQCIAMEPPEKKESGVFWKVHEVNYKPQTENPEKLREVSQEYHLPPEIFVSDGTPGSIVHNWVAARGGIGGIHHIAYQVESVEATMKEWKEKGYAEFTSDEPMKCPEDKLVQIFTKPSSMTGIIYEFIQRGEYGFCGPNVKNLMTSTKDLR